MARAFIGSRGPQRLLLDDDCGAKKPCSAGPCGEVTPGAPGGDLGVLPLLQVVYRHRVGYDSEEGTPIFDWETVVEGRAFVYETRTEWDASAGVTTIKANMVIGNVSHVEVPETAVVKEPETGLMWDIDQTTAFPDRLEIRASRVWREAESTPEDPLGEVWDGGDAFTTDWTDDIDGGGA